MASTLGRASRRASSVDGKMMGLGPRRRRQVNRKSSVRGLRVQPTCPGTPALSTGGELDQTDQTEDEMYEEEACVALIWPKSCLFHVFRDTSHNASFPSRWGTTLRPQDVTDFLRTST